VRVCLDTNVLVAAFATRGLCSDILRVCLTEHHLVLGEVHLAELRRALKRKLRLDEDRIAAVEAVFNEIDIVPKPAQPDALAVRDPDDCWIIATAMTGQADCLITGDADLLTIAKKAPLPVISPREFWEMLSSHG
jgi:putative PIN family toxin of toxin-antitoxin system